jgi:hypothetical protein
MMATYKQYAAPEVRDFVLTNYSPGRFTERIENVYNRLLQPT